VNTPFPPMHGDPMATADMALDPDAQDLWSREAIDAASNDDIRAALIVRPMDLDRQAAVMIIRDFGEGSLLHWPEIRKFIARSLQGGLFIDWAGLAVERRTGWPHGQPPLSESASGILALAIGLATGSPVEGLGRILAKMDHQNGPAILRGLARALHVEVHDMGQLR